MDDKQQSAARMMVAVMMPVDVMEILIKSSNISTYLSHVFKTLHHPSLEVTGPSERA